MNSEAQSWRCITFFSSRVKKHSTRSSRRCISATQFPLSIFDGGLISSSTLNTKLTQTRSIIKKYTVYWHNVKNEDAISQTKWPPIVVTSVPDCLILSRCYRRDVETHNLCFRLESDPSDENTWSGERDLWAKRSHDCMTVLWFRQCPSLILLLCVRKIEPR